MKLSNSELKYFMWSRGISPWKGELYGDAEYHTVQPDYLINKFHPYWIAHVKDHQLTHKVGRYECEDFCISYLACLREIPDRVLRSPAVGMFWFRPDKDSPYLQNAKLLDGAPAHSVIFAVKGTTLDNLQIYFIEPQSDMPLVNLSQKEVENCTGIYV